MDTTPGAWPGRSNSSAEPRQALGAPFWERGGRLRANVCPGHPGLPNPTETCCAMKATHSVSSKPLKLNGGRGCRDISCAQHSGAWGHPPS